MSMERMHKLAIPRGMRIPGALRIPGAMRILRGGLILLAALLALGLLGGAKDTAGKDTKAKDTKAKDDKAGDKAKAPADNGAGGGDKKPALAPADALSKAKAEIAADHVYSADALLQQVVGSSSASAAQVQEALYLQCEIYYGDVFGAALLLAPVSGSTGKPSKLGKEVSQQLLLARRAFHVSASSLLNEFVAKRELKTVKVNLPPFGESDVDKLNQTLASRDTMAELVKSYESDQSAGRGMLAKANHFGLYIGFGSALPKVKGRKMADVDSALSGGVDFSEPRWLDWLATVCIDMNGLIKNEPQAPRLGDLAKRADERLKKLLDKDRDNPLYKNAVARAKAY